MKLRNKLWEIIVLGMILYVAMIESSFAGMIRNNLNELKEKWDGLEITRKQYEETFRTLEHKRRQLEVSFSSCSNQEFRVLLQESGRIQEAESKREDLERENRKILKMNRNLRTMQRKLERRRISIEERFYKRQRGNNYRDAMQDYIDSAHEHYVDVIELILFPAYDQYILGIRSYLEVIRETVNHCNRPSVLPFETLIKNLTKSISVMVSTIESLGKSLGKGSSR